MIAPSRRAWTLFWTSAGLVVGFIVILGHVEHAWGLLPHALILACPPPRLFHGHGGPGHATRDTSKPDP
jgi:hypothetical protein